MALSMRSIHRQLSRVVGQIQSLSRKLRKRGQLWSGLGSRALEVVWRLSVSRHAKLVGCQGAEVSYRLWFPEQEPVGRRNLEHRLDANPWGVVFQGPFFDTAAVQYFLDFVSTIRDQRPEMPIVYSAYEHEFLAAVLPELANRGVKFVEFVDPGPLDGHSTSENLLRQVHSCWNGLTFLKSIGVNTAVRARTDQRFDPNRLVTAVSGVSQLVDDQGKPTSRIFGSSLNSFKNRPFGVSDMLLVADTSQLLRFFEKCDVQSYYKHRTAIARTFPTLEPSQLDTPEIFLGARYMASKALEPDENAVAAFWEHYFGIVPATFISHSWRRQPTWQHGSGHLWQNPESLRAIVGGEMTFEEWILLVAGRP